jgi:alkanesulfonate monooxygenase SsuD/methylene tetrahydromethanopterin reductase-like flavin-dependent oxidoreductase (luciferase family)
VDLGVVIRPEREPETLVGEARRAEAAGYDELWLWEDCFGAGGIAATATALAVTERIVVGLGIMPAPARNAAFAAMEVAALARLHPGRVHAGLGHGVAEWMRQIGARPASQLALLEEAVSAVRRLLAGETVSVEGRYVRLREVALDHPPRVVPPVSVGVRGPRSLELSGRCADGTVLDALSTPDYVRWARARIDAGRAAAGRADAHRITVFAFQAADAAGRAAVERQAARLREAGGAQADVLGTALPAATGGRDDPFVRALGEAGADCVVLVAPDPAVPLDVGAGLRPRAGEGPPRRSTR